MPESVEGSQELETLDGVNPFLEAYKELEPAFASQPAVAEDEGEEQEGTPAPQTPETTAEQSKPVSLDDVLYPEIEGAHGFLKGKPLSQVDRHVREVEGWNTRLATENKSLLGEKAALETMLQVYQQRLGPIEPAQPAQPQKRSLFQEVGIADIGQSMLLEPEKVEKALEQAIELKAAEKARAIVQEELGQRDQKAQAANQGEQVLRSSAEAFLELNIPREEWEFAFDLAMPILHRPDGPYSQSGGPLRKENFKDVLERSGFAARFRGTAAAPAAAAPAAPARPALEVDSEDPPGAKRSAPAVPPAESPLAKVDKNQLAQWRQIGHSLLPTGYTEEDMQDFLLSSAERFATENAGYRRRIKG